MGKGLDLARENAPEHAALMDDFKDQLMIVLLKRLAVDGKVNISLSEMDDTGQDMVSFSFKDKTFYFELSKKL